MRPFHKIKKNIYGLIFAGLLIAVLVLAWPISKSPTQSYNEPEASPKNTIKEDANFDKTAYPTDTAASLWVIVNKGRSLPGSYVPAGLTVPSVPLRYAATVPSMQLRSDAAAALEKLVAGAKADNIGLMLTSGYRSYDYQVTVYSNYVKQSGVQATDSFSARPGHSEHQTGLAADLEPTSYKCELDQCFGDLPEGQWLAANSYKYGFIIRYQKNTQNLTGYEYEPWHIRYIGVALASQIHDTGQTLEQFFGLPNYINYPAQNLILK